MNILNKLTIKHLKMNKKRTIVTIIGIILSTALMTGIGLLLSIFRESMIEEVIDTKGDYNVRIDDVDYNKIDIIKNNVYIKKYITREYIGYSKELREEKEKFYYKLYGISKEYMKHLNIIKGRMPENDNEIIVPSYLTKEVDNLEIGNSIILNLGDRYINDEKVIYLSHYDKEEYIKDPYEKEYKIVGIIEKDYYEDDDVGCYIYTLKNESQKRNLDFFITFKNQNKTYEEARKITTSLGLNYDSFEYTLKVKFNDNLLALYGISKYNNIITSLAGVLIIMLSVVSVACVIVIYNSFAISVMERKKQFGLFSSIGATKSQIKKTVLYEAFIVSLIGIPLGIISSYFGIWIVVIIIDKLLKDVIMLNLKMTVYPLFIIIPIIFMLITIFISAIIPAKRASKISPIEAIRLNDDIKIKRNKLSSPKIINKLFGIEGEIAYKNMKRNKKKYRVTVISLFISAVLFISFSSFLNYLFSGVDSYMNVPDLDILITYFEKDSNKDVINSIKNSNYIENISEIEEIYVDTSEDLSSIFTSKYKDYLEKNNIHDNNRLIILLLDDNSYNNYLKSLGKKVEKPILYNKYNDILISKNSRKSYSLKKYENKIANINIISNNYDDDNNFNDYQISTISDYYISDKSFFGLDNYNSVNYGVLIVNDNLAKQYNLNAINEFYNPVRMLIKSSSDKEIDKMIEEFRSNNLMDNIYYTNVKEEMRLMKNFVLATKILVYGFISLVTLIGVTSVFNTINTSIALRRKEFAVLRSIGLSPKGFNKMIRFESLFFGLKALLYAFPVSLIITILIHISMLDMVEFSYIIIPWNGIIMAIVLIFTIVAISMSYATKKIKNENILEAIREENI